MKLGLGKLPPEVLRRYVLGMTGSESSEIVLPPRVGLDFGAVKIRGGFLIVSSDPVTGVAKNIGSHAVVVSANDVATSGNRPQFMQSVILLPEGADESDLREISSQIGAAAKRLGISVVGGHTELTPGLERPIVMTTAFAIASSFVSANGARAGDTLMMTKSAGIEGTAILAEEAAKRGVRSSVVRRASRFLQRMSIVDEAESVFRTGFVHAMHDCTEGGVLGAIYEMGIASDLGFEVVEEKIPVASETAAVCAALRVDPLRLIGSGALLVAVKSGREDLVTGALSRKGIPIAAIGKFREGRRDFLLRNGGRQLLQNPPMDELWRVRRTIRSLGA